MVKASVQLTQIANYQLLPYNSANGMPSRQFAIKLTLKLTLIKAIIRRGVYKSRILYRYIYKQPLKKNLIIAAKPYSKR